MTDQDFDFIRRLLHEHSAIVLDAASNTSSRAALRRVLREHEPELDRGPDRPVAHSSRTTDCTGKSSRRW